MIAQQIGQVALDAIENQENSDIVLKSSGVTVSSVTWAAVNLGGQNIDKNQLGKNSCFSCHAESYEKCLLTGLLLKILGSLFKRLIFFIKFSSKKKVKQQDVTKTPMFVKLK